MRRLTTWMTVVLCSTALFALDQNNWLAAPMNSDWDNPNNWSAGTEPTINTDARFSSSNIRSITSIGTPVTTELHFLPGAQDFTIGTFVLELFPGITANPSIVVEGGSQTLETFAEFLADGTINITNGSTLTNEGFIFSSSITNLTLTGGTTADTFTNDDVLVNFNEVNFSNITFNNDGSFRDAISFTQTSGVLNNFGFINEIINFKIDGGVTSNQRDIDHIVALAVNGGRLINSQQITDHIGTFSISSGTYEVQVTSTSNRGFISSNFMQLGGNLRVDIEPGFSVLSGQEVLILDSQTPIVGRFATVSDNNPAVDVRVIYDPNQVFLVFLPEAPNAFIFNELQDPLYASVNHINFRIERELVKTRERFCSCGCPWNLFGGYIGTQGELNRRVDFDYHSNGFILGLDRIGSSWAFGASLNYERLSSDDNHRFGRFDIDFVHGDIFGTYVTQCLPCLAFDVIVGFGHQWWDTHRDVGFTGGLATMGTVARGQTDATEWDILFGAEYALTKLCNILTVPYATIQYIHIGLDGFDERGAGFFNFGTRDRDLESLRSVLGFRFLGNYCFCNNSIVFEPEIDIAWEREYLEDRGFFVEPVIGRSFGRFFDRGDLEKNFLLFAADLYFGFCGRYGLDLSYDLEWNNQFQNHTYYVGGNVRF